MIKLIDLFAEQPVKGAQDNVGDRVPGLSDSIPNPGDTIDDVRDEARVALLFANAGAQNDGQQDAQQQDNVSEHFKC